MTTALDRMLARALAVLADDGVIAYPTETVWGLGACADRPRAVERLLAWKGRGPDAPLAVLVPTVDPVAQARALGCQVEAPARRLIAAFWPGPLMLVLPGDPRVADGVARADGALGLRCSPHPIAAALANGLAEAGLGPLTSTSLNRSGEPPATNAEAAARSLRPTRPGSQPPMAESDRRAEPWLFELAEMDAGGAEPSTVVDCTQAVPEILRMGAIAETLIRRTLAEEGEGAAKAVTGEDRLQGGGR